MGEGKDPLQRVELWKTTPAEFDGWLSKQGAGGFRMYKRRWCKLVDRFMFYFKADLRKDQSQKPQGYIDLTCTKLVEDIGHKFAFCLSGPNLPRTYFFTADTEEEKQAWWKSLTKIIDKISPEVRRKVGFAAHEELPKKSTLLINNAKNVDHNEPPGLQDFELLTVIGRGSFGKVIKVKHKRSGEVFAMKILRKDLIFKENMIEHTKSEKNILQTIDHPFIVSLRYAFQTADKLYLILDFLPGGEIFFHLQKAGKFTEPQAKQYAAELVLALDHLHQQSVIYRDLKPENCVLDSEGFVVLTDFGLAKKCIAQQPTYTFCGTPEYLAPEILQNKGHTKAVDWWSLGVLLYEMIFGLPPFYSENLNEMYQMILRKDVSIPTNTSKELTALIRGLLMRDPANRLQDGDTIRSQEWFSDIDWDALMARKVRPLFVPDIRDTKNFDTQFTRERAVISICHAPAGAAAKFMEDEFKDFAFKQEGGAPPVAGL